MRSEFSFYLHLLVDEFFLSGKEASELGGFTNFWIHWYCTGIFHGCIFSLSGMLKGVSDRRRSSPRHFTEIVTKPLDLRLF